MAAKKSANTRALSRSSMAYRTHDSDGPPTGLENLGKSDFVQRMPETLRYVIDARRPIPDDVAFVPRIIGVIVSILSVIVLTPMFVIPLVVPFYHWARGRSSVGELAAEIGCCLAIAAIPGLMLWIFGTNLAQALLHALGRYRGGFYCTHAYVLYREGDTIWVCPIDAVKSLAFQPVVTRLPRGGTSRSYELRLESTSGGKLKVSFGKARGVEKGIEKLRAIAAARKIAMD